ncbi:DUF4442 domain-containing protein [Nocardia heshunensis]
MSHRVRPWNRNINGAAFGGTLYAMTDPFFGVMARGQLGEGYRVWSVRSGIEFVAPGRGTVTAIMELDAAQAEQIRHATRDGALLRLTPLRAAGRSRQRARQRRERRSGIASPRPFEPLCH